MHGWDIAVSTGQRYEPTVPEVDAAMSFVASFDAPQDGNLFGPVVPVADDAPPLDRLIGLTGRDPARQLRLDVRQRKAGYLVMDEDGKRERPAWRAPAARGPMSSRPPRRPSIVKATNLADLYELPLLDWDPIEARLGQGMTQAPNTGGPDRHTCWLATINPDGSPHVNGIGA